MRHHKCCEYCIRLLNYVSFKVNVFIKLTIYAIVNRNKNSVITGNWLPMLSGYFEKNS